MYNLNRKLKQHEEKWTEHVDKQISQSTVKARQYTAIGGQSLYRPRERWAPQQVLGLVHKLEKILYIIFFSFNINVYYIF